MNSRFQLHQTRLQDLQVVERLPISDQRGFLERLYCSVELREAGLRSAVAQINRTLTKARGTVRGMHFQLPPHSETKLVSCLRGEVFDVAVDLRAGSRTLLHWHAETLSAQNHRSVLIPAGFAHGFQTLTDDCEMLYLHTACYEPAAQGAVSPRDPRIGIAWPLPLGGLSERDAGHPFLAADYCGIQL
jgi:dTDP-4-dehydrorhamnose 3,5-epimerase